MASRASRRLEREVETAAHFWPGYVALLAFGVAYALVSSAFTLGPPWLMLAVILVGIVVARVLHWRGLVHQRRVAFLVVLSVLTLGIATSAGFLLQALLTNHAQAGDLLLSAALLWTSNILIFSVWYWELDGGGPHHRTPSNAGARDFAFPQMLLDEASRPPGWVPYYLDYLFLSFNTSTAFSPTDTMVLGRRAKVIMMLQSIISLTTIAVLAARAINTLPS
jgi:hypothetical protein